MNVKAQPAVLRSIRLFASLDAEQYKQIAAITEMLQYPAGSLIVGRNDDDSSVFFILSGSVRVTSFSANGREASFHDKLAGDYFGELAAIDGNPRAADVVATRDATLLRIGGADFRALINNNSALSQTLTRELAAEVRQLTQRVYEFSVLKVQERIQKRIMELAIAACEKQGVGIDSTQGVNISDFPKHSDIASRIATTREAVTREISRLQKLGLLERLELGVRVNNMRQFAALLEE